MLKWLSILWWKLVGNPGNMSPEHRAFNAIALITIFLLSILIPLNIALRLWVISVMLAIIEIVLVVLFVRSRVYGRYAFSLLIYGIASYIVVAITFLYNAGSDGPALYLFLLTYLFLIAFTNHQLHRTWTILHLVIPVLLLAVEYRYPELKADGYESSGYRYLDLASTLVIIVSCTYAVTIYLRRNYEQEKANAKRHANKIESQNKKISAQNQLLQQSNGEKLRLISILAHDLRNPMSAITGVLEILTQEQTPEELRRKMLEELLSASRNTSAMLDNLLSWTSGQIKGLKPISTKVKPKEVITHVLDVQQFIATKKEITIRTSVDEDVTIWADMDMLELIIRNLISNALKFTPKNGIIDIALHKDEKHKTCMLSIHDNGIGIANEDLRRLFDGNIQSTYGTESEKGIGLGLFLSKELTSLNGGKIEAKSTLGEGSTFTLTFPLCKEKKVPVAMLSK